VFLEQFFLFHFSELNYYSLFHLLFFFEVQKFELLGGLAASNFGEVKGFPKKQCVKNMYFYRLLLLKSLFTPLKTLSTHFPPNTSGHAQLSNNTG